VPPGRLVHAKVGGAVAGGGALSLFLCGQMGLGLFTSGKACSWTVDGLRWSSRVYRRLRAIVCSGARATAGIFSSRIQYLVLRRKKRPHIPTWVLACGLFLILRNEQHDVMLTMAI
jgi:hypothetical protein